MYFISSERTKRKRDTLWMLTLVLDKQSGPVRSCSWNNWSALDPFLEAYVPACFQRNMSASLLNSVEI